MISRVWNMTRYSVKYSGKSLILSLTKSTTIIEALLGLPARLASTTGVWRRLKAANDLSCGTT